MTETNRPALERLPLDGTEAQTITTPSGYVLIELLRLNPEVIVPVFNQLADTSTRVFSAKSGWTRRESLPPDSDEGWGDRGLVRSNRTLRDPVSKTTYAQEFKQQHPRSVSRALKPSDDSVRHL